MLPDYIAKALPNPHSNRAAWFKNIAPSYAGVFLWVVFYEQLAGGTLTRAGVGLSLLALLAAGLLCFGFYYFAPAMLGMKTGYPLYVVGSSTFGTTGGYLMPGLLMGLLQIGWFAVNISLSTTYLLRGAGWSEQAAVPDALAFKLIAIAWGAIMAYIGVKGIQYVARVSLYLSLIAFLMVLLVFVRNVGGVAAYEPPDPAPLLGMAMLVQIVIGFFATAGAAGADFGMNARNARDVKWGGLVGITVAILYAGGLPLMSVAGANAAGHAAVTYSGVIDATVRFLASPMFLLFALASVAPACFCAFIAGNSFATMLPKIPRMASTMVGAAIAVTLAVTGAALNLVGVFKVVGASFGPICGAMTADYLLSGRKWAGPRQGINWAGYIAWALGFTVGIVDFLPVSEAVKNGCKPEVLWSYVVGFAVYALLAKVGLQPKTVEIEGAPGQADA
ncbi:MAG: cytosine permease [Bryobacteraceae bacterium]